MIEDEKTVAWLLAEFDPLGSSQTEHCAQGGLGFGLIHYSWIRIFKPARVLAIGSRTGFIPACMAAAVKANGCGVVDFVDAALDAGDDNNWGGKGWWKTHDFGQFNDVVRMHVKRTDEFFPTLPSDVSYGYAHIDGGHDFATCNYDLEQSISRLEPSGIISLHDTTQPVRLGFGVAAAVNQYRDTWNVIEFRDCGGNVWMQRR
jgi:hypothetical protein